MTTRAEAPQGRLGRSREIDSGDLAPAPSGPNDRWQGQPHYASHQQWKHKILEIVVRPEDLLPVLDVVAELFRRYAKDLRCGTTSMS